MTAQRRAPHAGWYPAEPGFERWWNGAQWTDRTRRIKPPKYVTYGPKHTSHAFHLIMTLLTCGLWAIFVWIPATIINAMRREKHVTRVR